MSQSRQIVVLVSTLLLVSACGGGGSTTSDTPLPTPTGSAIPPATGVSFCEAALAWAQSPAAAEAQVASQSGDAAALVAAYRNWAGPTQAMADAVPSDAPQDVQKAFADLNESVQTIAEEGAQSQKQADAYGAAQDTVLEYYGKTCG
jgi:hypothetical protein